MRPLSELGQVSESRIHRGWTQIDGQEVKRMTATVREVVVEPMVVRRRRHHVGRWISANDVQ
jgi:hypothetical protein